MTEGEIALQGAVDDAAWKLLELQSALERMPPTDPARGAVEQEAAMLARRIDMLLLDGEPIGEWEWDDEGGMVA